VQKLAKIPLVSAQEESGLNSGDGQGSGGRTHGVLAVFF
jgi:hypothetical protein